MLQHPRPLVSLNVSLQMQMPETPLRLQIYVSRQYSAVPTSATLQVHAGSRPAHPEARLRASAERNRRSRRTSTARHCARSKRQSTSLQSSAPRPQPRRFPAKPSARPADRASSSQSCCRHKPHKEVCQPQRPHDVARRIDGLIGEHRHQPVHALGSHPVRPVGQPRQHFRNALINRGVIELVLPVVAQKILQSRSECCFGAVVPVAEGATDERGRAISLHSWQ
jgi:hypothetical protein